LSEREKRSVVEKLAETALQRLAGGVRKSVERFVKRMVKLITLAIAGTVIALLGLGFLAVGVVKWFSTLMPSWLAWLVVGLVLLLLGLVVTLFTLVSSRS